jgi:hypothetical protein
MKSITITVMIFLSGLIVSNVQAEIYSWTDENGVKHYSHTPPPEQDVQFTSAPEIKTDPTVVQKEEKINEQNVEALLKEPGPEESAPPPDKAASKKPPTREQRIQAEAEKLQEKIAFLEQLPPEAYTNMRSKQAIIGRYQYRLTELQSDPDSYFKQYGQ